MTVKTFDVAKVYDDYLDQIRGEFVDEAEDNLNTIEVALENFRSGQETGKRTMDKIRRPIHSLKGSSSLADFPLVAIIMHRLEDYLGSLNEIEEASVIDILAYIDRARELSVLTVDQKAISSAELVRELPGKPNISEKEEKLCMTHNHKIEAMIIMKEKTSGMLFERELRNEGIRTTSVRNSFSAIEMIVRTRPNVVLVSAILDELSGVDVACAVKSMPVTSDIPVCLLTSFSAGHPELADLPEGVDLIHKNNFKNDLQKALKDYGLI